jgi:alpha-beta hydrolase superfamily lysophospholipase
MLAKSLMDTSLTLHSADGTRLAARYWPTDPPSPAVVIVPGLGSRKEHHADFAVLCYGAGLAALTLDIRGHGASEGRLGPRAVDDVLAAIAALRARGHERIGLRGSSLGAFLVLTAAARSPRVSCVVAICPAQSDALALRLGEQWPTRYPLARAVSRADGIARGYWHATGDERVPWCATAALAQLTPQPRRLHIVLGGHHQSLQHDPVVLADTRDFLCAYLR